MINYWQVITWKVVLLAYDYSIMKTYILLEISKFLYFTSLKESLLTIATDALFAVPNQWPRITFSEISDCFVGFLAPFP